MQEQSFEEWYGSLPGQVQERVRRMVAEMDPHGQDPDVRRRVRADMGQDHAPLAFNTFFECVHPGEWTLDARCQVEELLGRDTLAWQESFGPHIRPGREAVERIIAKGNSYEDLAAFAFLVAAAKVDCVGFSLSHGEFFADLPGWRLMETWHGELTGRPLSIWGVHQSRLAGGMGAVARNASPHASRRGGPDGRCGSGPDDGSGAVTTIAITPDPAISDRPLIGPGFWEAVRRARLEGSPPREPTGRGGPRPKTRQRRSELGAMVITLIDDLRLALGHEDDLHAIDRGMSKPAGPGPRHVDEAAFERLLAVPLRTIIALLSATAAGEPGPPPPVGLRP